MKMCTTCQHLKRPEIDRRLAAGEPLAPLAKEYDIHESSLRRHRLNCLGLGSSNAIKKEAARGSAAVALLPSAATLSEAYRALGERIDEIVVQAKREGSLRTALSGLASFRQTLDSLARLAAHDPGDQKQSQPGPGYADVQKIAERLIQQFDQEPETKARIAAALVQMDDEGHGSSPQPPQAIGDADARELLRQPAATSEPASELPTTGLAAAINVNKADHAIVAAASAPCKTVSTTGGAPRSAGTSPTPLVQTNANGNSNVLPEHVGTTPPTNGGDGRP